MKRRRQKSGHRSRDHRQRTQTLVGAIIIVVVLLVVIGVVSTRWMLGRNTVPMFADTMCPKAGPYAYTVVLIDGTDTFTAVQVADLQRYFALLKGNIQKYEQIAIYAPREMSAENLLQPTLKICSPGDNTGISDITGCRDCVQRTYDKKFSEQIDIALGLGLDASGSTTSPIMEMIQAVVIDGFPIDSSVPKRLIIVSDMLQNSDYYSHYRDEIAFDALRQNPAFQHVITNLSGVDVEILYIGRKGSEQLQTNRHGLFWETFFRHMNGNLHSITRVGG